MKDDDIKLAVVLVGVPARGKTYISSKLSRYLKWKGIVTKIFNTGMYRQSIKTQTSSTHVFFDHEDPEGTILRNKVIDQCFNDFIVWLAEPHNRVGIYDATNITRVRRSFVKSHIENATGAKVFFIESFCDDPAIIKAYMEEVKITSPDYMSFSPEAALEDFEQRIAHYLKVYEPLDMVLDGDLSFLKMINVGRQIMANEVTGYLCTGIVYFLMNIHIIPRSIYMTRHGESEYNLEGKLGGDPELSSRGKQYAHALHTYMSTVNPDNLQVWTSTLKRSILTAKHFETPRREWRCLEEINAGICDGLTYAQVEELYPLEFAAREQDKYHYRYPRGESYHDIVMRLEPVMMELERAHNVLLIGHQAVLRCILAYFLDKTAEELPYVKVPLHTVMKLTPVAYGCRVEMVPLNIDAVDTYRPPSEATLEQICKNCKPDLDLNLNE